MNLIPVLSIYNWDCGVKFSEKKTRNSSEPTTTLLEIYNWEINTVLEKQEQHDTTLLEILVLENLAILPTLRNSSVADIKNNMFSVTEINVVEK